MKQALICVVFVCATAVVPAYAAPDKTPDKAQAEALKKEAAALEKQARELQAQTVEKAKDVQQLERRLVQAEASVSRLKVQRMTAEAQVKQGKAKLSDYTHAMLRLSEVPPEAMIMLPELGTEHLQAAAALKLMSDAIAIESAAVDAALSQLKALEVQERKELEAIEESLAAQKEKKQALDAALQTQQGALKQNATEQKALQEAMRSAAKASRSTKELIGKLGSKPSSAASKASLSAFASSSKLRAPVAGRVVKKFGTSSVYGDKGIVIESRAGATVTAPFDGEVVFAGSFMNYGRMVILRHKGDYHSVLSGLDTVNAKLGEAVVEGEPIGAMGDGESPQLYFEFRKGTQSVNPASFIAG